jgi:pimeloyl-ACP methyl ester carboxylesterase
VKDVSGLNVTQYGEHGSPVAFLHGLFGQGRNWTGIAKALAPHHRVVLIDLPDHGRSAWTEQFDLLAVADLIAGLFDAADPVALVGHSLGGKVAMVLALRRPDLVERLCDAEAALAGAVGNPTVRSFLLQNLRRESQADGGSSWRWQANLAGLGRDLPAISSWPGDRLGDASYDGPVLWMSGANSDYVVEDHAPAMDALFPHNRRVTIKNAGHWLHSEKPEVFLEVLERFLDAPRA